jgi:hypothetical protein
MTENQPIQYETIYWLGLSSGGFIELVLQLTNIVARRHGKALPAIQRLWHLFTHALAWLLLNPHRHRRKGFAMPAIQLLLLFARQVTLGRDSSTAKAINKYFSRRTVGLLKQPLPFLVWVTFICATLR